jgi:hypothetical protein
VFVNAPPERDRARGTAVVELLVRRGLGLVRDQARRRVIHLALISRGMDLRECWVGACAEGRSVACKACRLPDVSGSERGGWRRWRLPASLVWWC